MIESWDLDWISYAIGAFVGMLCTIGAFLYSRGAFRANR